MSSSSHAVEVVDLVKRYPKQETNAVDAISFNVGVGEVFGLLGPNGAGKSTTVGILTTRMKATSGQAFLSGYDVLKDPVGARARLAVVAQRPNLDRSLTPRQNLAFHAAYHGVGRAERNKRAGELLEVWGLTKQADVKVDWYSGGMAQRLMIARALIHEPDVLFLDEPTTGLDPQARLFVWDRINDMRARGKTIVLTTHDMTEAADLCDRVGIVDHGKLLALDTPEALTRNTSGQSVLDLTVAPADSDDHDGLLTALLSVDGVDRAERMASNGPPGGGGQGPGGPGGGPGAGPSMASPPSMGAAPIDPKGPVKIRAYLSVEPAAALAPVVSTLAARGAALTDIHIGTASLEDVFIGLTGRGLR